MDSVLYTFVSITGTLLMLSGRLYGFWVLTLL